MNETLKNLVGRRSCRSFMVFEDDGTLEQMLQIQT